MASIVAASSAVAPPPAAASNAASLGSGVSRASVGVPSPLAPVSGTPAPPPSPPAHAAPPAPGPPATTPPPVAPKLPLPLQAPVAPTVAQGVAAGNPLPGLTPDPARAIPPTAQAGPAPAGAVVPAGELTGARTPTSKTFATATPGQLVSQAYSGAVNYRGADGVLHDIDPSLVAAAPGRYQTKATAVGVDLAASPNDPNLAVVSFDPGHKVTFGLTGAQARAAAAPQMTTLSDGRPPVQAIVHSNIEPGVDLKLAPGDGGLKEAIVLASPNTPETFSFPLHLTGLSASVDPASGDVVYTQSNGTVVGRTPHGFMTDSKIDPHSGDPATSQGVTYAIAGSGPDVTLTVTLDHAWLADPARVYPVSVDPTLSPDASDDTYSYLLSPPGTTYDNSGDYQLKVGTFNSGTNKARSFMHFNNLSYLNGSQVSSAILYLYEFHSYICTPETTDIFSVNQAWTGSSVTTWPGPSLGALAGSASSALGDTCGGGGWVAFDVTSTVANWAATNGASNNGLAVVAPDETNSYLWKLFYSWNESNGAASTTPYLNITWNTPATAPSSPTNAVATPANNSANVTWGLSASDGGAAIDSYWVNVFDGNTNAYLAQVSVCATCTSATIGGLMNGHPYWFAVYAHNGINFSNPAITNTIVPTPPPGPPRGAVATPGNGSATMVWAPPAPNGGSPVNGYAVLAYDTNNNYTGHDALVCATCYSATVTGLTNGVAYNLFVLASNPAGYGSSAESGPVTPNTNVPGAAAGATAWVPGSGSVGVAWNPPASSGVSPVILYAINTYDLATGFQASTGVAVYCPCGSVAFTAVTGLTTGHNYFFAIYAYNSAGYGPAATTGTIAPNPAAPGPSGPVTVAPGNASLTATWSAPAATGTSPIDNYLVYAYDTAGGGVSSGLTCPCTTPPSATVTGLTNGHTYQIGVYAHNAAGYGPPAASAFMTAGVPGAPPNVVAVPHDGYVQMTWGTPPSNGQSITGYTITVSPAHAPGLTTTQNSGIIAGLRNGTAYTFTAVATNSVGASPAVQAVLTPAGLPLQPSQVHGTQSGSTATVTWQPPVSRLNGQQPGDNGSPITSYTVSVTPPDAGPWQTGQSGRQANLTGLNPASTYTYAVTANSAVGTGTAATDPIQVPPVSPSRYMTSTWVPPNDVMPLGDPSGDVTLCPTCGGFAFNEGNHAGALAATHNGETVTMLHFGQIQGSQNTGVYGGYQFQTPTSNDIISLDQARTIAFEYAAGWYAGARSNPQATLRLMLGFSNYGICPPQAGSPPCDPQQFGQLVAFAIYDAVQAINSHNWETQVYLWAASDSETQDGYSRYSKSAAVEVGFSCIMNFFGPYVGMNVVPPDPNPYAGDPSPLKTTCVQYPGISSNGTGLQSKLFDIGNASSVNTTDPSLGWTNAQIYNYVYANGPNFLALPQILTTNNPQQWVVLAQQGYSVQLQGVETDCPFANHLPAPDAYKSLATAVNQLTMPYATVINTGRPTAACGVQ